MLLVHAGLIARAATKHSPTYDEVAWLPAGISHWELGRFDLARVNPPLVRLVAALPVTIVAHEVDWTRYAAFPADRPEFGVGTDFMRVNGPRSFWLFTLGRWACIPFSVVGAYVCYRWAKQLYGALAGCLSLTLWCFCPNVLAHAELITSDVAGASLGCAACYAFWLWLRQPTLNRACICGVVVGLAELAKTTWLILFLLLPLLWIFWHSTTRVPRKRLKLAHEAFGLGAILVLAILLLNVGYGFEGAFKPLGQFRFVSRVLTVDDAGMPMPHTNRFRDSFFGTIPVPLPENYLLGIDQTKAEFELGKRSYLRGEWKLGGWWYYYLYGLAVKVPLGTWGLFFLAFGVRVAGLRKPRRSRAESSASHPDSGPGRPLAGAEADRAMWRDELVLLLPAAVLLTLVSSQAGSNALRYVLPAFPFIFVWMGKVVEGPMLVSDLRAACIHGRKSWSGLRLWLAAAAAAFSVVSCLCVYPHCLAYFNALGGGPLGGHAHLVGSNIDWGQDLLYLRSWLDEHPEARPLRLAYFGLTDPRLAGIDFELPPCANRTRTAFSTGDEGPRPGWHAISVNFLRGYQIPAFDATGLQVPISGNCYSYFLQSQRVAVAGRSIYIYHLTLGEANRLRARLGFPLLSG